MQRGPSGEGTQGLHQTDAGTRRDEDRHDADKGGRPEVLQRGRAQMASGAGTLQSHNSRERNRRARRGGV